MDTLTHIVTGACIGELIAGKTIGRRAMLLGAGSQLIPDIDAVTHLWLDNIHGLVTHRGLTHSLLFAVVVSLLVGFIVHRLVNSKAFSFRTSLLLVGLNVFVHLFLDCFNAYGTALLEPFSDRRFFIHALYVVDPFFSAWPFLACIFLVWLNRHHGARKLWARAGIGFSIVYLLYAVTNKLFVEREVSRNIREQGIAADKYFTTPTPLNSWLWFVVIKAKDGYYTGYRSVLDRDKHIDLLYVPQNDSLLAASKNQYEISLLKKFAQDYYTVEKRRDSILVFNVLRFGQVTGWHSTGNFAFYYYLDGTGDNNLVVQRGRFENWNRETFLSLVKRIRGD